LFRIGQGIDFHRFKAGRRLILGNIEIEYEFGLEGHSDADVLIHSIMDALLGAAGLKDIGYYFPDTDEKYKNIDSGILLENVVSLIRGKGFEIVNIDATIIAQKPKILPYIDEMKTRLSSIMNITREQISIKATTTEKMGFIGRQEGIASMSVVLLRYD